MKSENLLSKAIVAKELAIAIVSVGFELDSLNLRLIDSNTIANLINERLKKSSLILNIEAFVFCENAENSTYNFAVRLINSTHPLAVISIDL